MEGERCFHVGDERGKKRKKKTNGGMGVKRELVSLSYDKEDDYCSEKGRKEVRE